MEAWRETDSKKLRQKLWHSVDMLYVKGWLIGLLIVEVLAPLLFLLRDGYSDNFWAVTWIIGGITAVPILLLCLWRTWQIFRHAKSYTFCRAKLTSAHYRYLWKAMSFTVVVTDMDGHKIPAQTRAIFHTHGFIPPVMEDYQGRTVTVGYNEENGSIVVIG